MPRTLPAPTPQEAALCTAIDEFLTGDGLAALVLPTYPDESIDWPHAATCVRDWMAQELAERGVTVPEPLKSVGAGAGSPPAGAGEEPGPSRPVPSPQT